MSVCTYHRLRLVHICLEFRVTRSGWKKNKELDTCRDRLPVIYLKWLQGLNGSEKITVSAEKMGDHLGMMSQNRSRGIDRRGRIAIAITTTQLPVQTAPLVQPSSSFLNGLVQPERVHRALTIL